MNKKELEKILDEEFDGLCLLNSDGDNVTYRIKEVFFEEMLPKALKSIIINKIVALNNNIDDINEEKGYNKCIDDIEKHVKELYNIDL